MGGASVAAASAVMCAVVSLSWAAADPAQAVGPSGGTPGTLGSVVGGAGGAMGDAGSTVGGTVNDAGSTVGGTVNDAGSTVGGTVNDAGNTAGGTVGDAGRTVGSAVDHVADSAGVRVPHQVPAAAPPTPHSASPSVGSAPHDPSEPDSGHGDAVPRAAAPTPAKDAAPATATRARPSWPRDRARARHVSPAEALAARRLILASLHLDWRHSFAAVGRGERSGVAIPKSFYDESCRSGSLAVRDLRRCAYASTLIPQLGGPSSVLLVVSLAMIGAGLVLVARRRRVTPVGPAVG